MMDIYNSESIRSLSGDIYNSPSIMVLCHTSLGDINANYGVFFEAGKEYILIPEVVTADKDTNYKECILCWIKMSREGFGGRFSIVGNIYKSGDEVGYWPNFVDYFTCPISRERTDKLKELGI